MIKKIQEILDTDLSSNKIATVAEVEQSTVYRLRNKDRQIKNLSIEVAQKLLNKYEELVPMKKTSVLTEEQVQKLAEKCKGMDNVSITKDLLGNDRITFKNGNFVVETRITADSTTVKAFAVVNSVEFGKEETNITTVEELYNALRSYANLFVTGGEVTKTMLWIKQMYM